METHVLYTWIWRCLDNLATLETVGTFKITDDISTRSFLDLCNGCYLNALMLYIYPSAKRDDFDPVVLNVGVRLRNLRILMRSIQAFYRDALNQKLVMPLPDILSIARNPYQDLSGEEMKKVLLLMLGCAVQSDRREEFINQIKCLDTATQQSLVEEISKITVEGRLVLNIDAWKETAESENFAMFIDHLSRLIAERDEYAQHLLEVNQEQESDGSSSPSVCYGYSSQGKLPESLQQDYNEGAANRHISIELADLRAKLRRTTQELEEKVEVINLFKEEIAEKDGQFAKVRQENFELLKNVRLLKEYRDEVDVLREKTIRFNQLEVECERYKERLSEFGFLKSRTDELSTENGVLLETRTLLEDQISSLRKTLSQYSDREAEIIRFQRKISDLEQQVMLERRRVQQLAEENSQLVKESFDHRSSQSRTLDEEERVNGDAFSADEEKIVSPESAERLKESLYKKMETLDLENRKLRHSLEFNCSDLSLMDSSLETSFSGKFYKCTSFPMNLMEELNEVNNQSAHVARIAELERREKDLQRQLNDSEMLNANLRRELSKLESESNEMTLKIGRETANALQMEKCELLNKNTTLVEEINSLKSQMKANDEQLEKLQEEKMSLEAVHCSTGRERSVLKQENETLRKALESTQTELERYVCQLEELKGQCYASAESEKVISQLRSKNTSLEGEKRRQGQEIEMLEKQLTALSNDLVTEKKQLSALDQLTHDVRVCLEQFQVPVEGIAGGDKSGDVRALYWRLISHLKGQINELTTIAASKDGQIERIGDQLTELKSRLNTDYALKCNTGPDRTTEELKKINNLLIDENKSIRHKMVASQEQMDKLESKLIMATKTNNQLTQQLREVQFKSAHQVESENASLLVELRSLKLNLEVIKEDNTELQRQCETWERNAEHSGRSFKELRFQHQALLKDHERLQSLHEQLNADYDRLRQDVQSAKASLRQARQQCHEHDVQIERLSVEKQQLTTICQQLEQRDNKRKQNDQLVSDLQSECSFAKNEYAKLKAQMDDLLREKEKLVEEHRRLKTDSGVEEFKTRQAVVKLEEAEDLIRRLQLDFARSQQQCEELALVNQRLNDERKALLNELDSLLVLKEQNIADWSKREQRNLDMRKVTRTRETEEESFNSDSAMPRRTVIAESTKKKHRTTFVKRAARVFSSHSSSKKTDAKFTASSADESAASTDEFVIHSTNVASGSKNGISSLRHCTVTNSLSSQTSSSQSSEIGERTLKAPYVLTRENYGCSERAVDVPGDSPIRMAPYHLETNSAFRSPKSVISYRSEPSKPPPPYPGRFVNGSPSRQSNRQSSPWPASPIAGHGLAMQPQLSTTHLPKASTPKLEDNSSSATSCSSAHTRLHPGNNSLVSSELTSSESPTNVTKVSEENLNITLSNSPVKFRSTKVKRDTVLSVYDNVIPELLNGDEKPTNSSNEETLTEALRESKAENENAVWFEYGCV